MADISNMIAQFGQDAGSGIAQGFQRGLQRRERNRLLDLNQQAQQRQEQQRMAEAQRKRQEADRKAQYEYMQRGTQVLAQTPPEQRAQVWGGLMQGAQERGWDIAGEEQWDEARLPELMGRFGTASKGSDLPTSVRDRNALFAIIEDPEQPEWKRKAARIDLGLDPRAVGSSATTIAEEGKTDLVAGSEATIAGAKAGASERAKIDARLDNAERETQAEAERVSAVTTAKEGAIKRAELENPKAVQMRETGAQLVRDLLSPDMIDATKKLFGPIQGTDLAQAFSMDPKVLNAKAKLQQLRDIATAENMAIMSGVLSESDLKVIGNIAGGGLVGRQSDDQAIDNLRQLEQVFGGSAQAEQGEQPPVEGARQAPDGKWYVERNGQFYRVDS